MDRYLSVFGYFVLWLLAPTSFNLQWSDYRGGWMPGPGMMGWGGLGWIFMIVFWALVIVGLIFLVKWLAGLSHSQTMRGKGPDSAMEILRERYAKGEINKEEFEQKKRDLM
jgi:putative membrane protein